MAVTDRLAPALALGRGLRAAGVPVGTGRLLTLAQAVEAVGVRDLYWAGRATLVSRREDLPVYEQVFREVIGGLAPPPTPVLVRMPRVAFRPIDATGEGEPAGGEQQTSLASSAELLRRKSFAGCDERELAQLHRMMARLRLRAPVRRTRRRRPARAGDPDLRRTLRRAMRTGGEPLDRAFRRRRVRRRRLVLVLDVSGSMAAYSRALALFAHAALRADPDWEAFAFGTRLTRMSPALMAASPDEAFRRIAAEATDWDGGTRIGLALKGLIDAYGRGRTLRGAIVIVLSDGLDVGDPELLAEQMARLRRLAHRIVWINPLKENPDYAPLARGMRAALPHIDVFRTGHNLQSLEELADVVARL